MTIRSGGGPRGTRQAHPIEHQTSDEDPHHQGVHDDYRDEYAYGGGRSGNGNGNGYGYGNGRRRGSGSSGAGGVLRFLVFAAILAAVVLIALVTVLRPVINGAVVGWADDNPGALGIDFVADMVRADLGPKLTAPASTDAAQLPFQVGSGESATTIAARLEDQGFITDRRAFVLLAVERGLADQLKTGEFILRKTMTPDELVTALLNPPPDPFVQIDLRTGLRLEQVTAKLETIDGLEMNPRDFYEEATHPTPELLADYPWLEMPDGASLEGYLWPANYRVLPDTSADELIRLMLDRFHDAIGDRMDVPSERGMDFYKVLTLASLVEKEAILNEEKPLIAGVYQNRLDGKNGHTLLQADPTVIYAYDTDQLNSDKWPFENWKGYTFGNVPEGVGLADVPLSDGVEGFNTYRNGGLPPGPIATPTLSSIDAALNPDTKDGYLFFLAKNDGSQAHAFAKTLEEHEANMREFGY